MKTITIYELIGLVKEDKAPRKIRYKDKIYYYHKGYDFNYIYNSSNNSPMDKNKSLFTFNSYKLKDGRHCWDDNTTIDFLNDKVEILEDTNEITAEQIMMATDTLNRLKPTIIEATSNWNKVAEAIKNNFNTLKEEKKIPEKLNLDKDELRNVESPRIIDYFIESKINEIIDYLKSKGGLVC